MPHTLLIFTLVSLFKSVPFIESGIYDISNPSRGNLPFRQCATSYCNKKHHHDQKQEESVFLLTYLGHGILTKAKA